MGLAGLVGTVVGLRNDGGAGGLGCEAVGAGCILRKFYHSHSPTGWAADSSRLRNKRSSGLIPKSHSSLSLEASPIHSVEIGPFEPAFAPYHAAVSDNFYLEMAA